MEITGNRLDRLRDAVAKVTAEHDLNGNLDDLLNQPAERNLFVERLTAELTVGETFFFRNEHHFQALREIVIPQILRDQNGNGEVRLWSAGCATGEEPYSLAILIDQIFRDQGPEFNRQAYGVSVLATDINNEFLQRARNAEYRKWSFRRTDIHNDDTYFTTLRDSVCLRSPVRQWVRFMYLNLVKDLYPSPLNGTTGLDLILFRNVAIYLQPEVVAAIVARFNRCLRPGGWLLLGEAEVMQIKPHGFNIRRIGQATFFQKPDAKTLAQPTADTRRPVLPADYREASDSVAKSTLSERTVTPPKRPPKPTIPNRPPLPQRAIPTAEARTFDWNHVEQLLINEDVAAAETELKKIRVPGDRANLRLRCVRRLLELSQMAQAREMLDRCLSEEPLLIEGHLLKASLAEERGDLDEAESACRRALYLDRNGALAHFHLALIQQQRGDLSGSQRSLDIVQKIAKSEDPNALVEHGDGVCYGRLFDMARSMTES